MIQLSKKREKSKNEKLIEGISLATTFILFGIFLYFTPEFFLYKTLTTVLGLLSIVIGIMGLSFEMSKINDESVGFSDLGLGLGFLIVWAIIYYYLPNVWINIFSSLFLFFGLYGSFSGTIKVAYGFVFKRESRWKLTSKALVILLQLIGFVSAILTIVNSIGLMNK